MRQPRRLRLTASIILCFVLQSQGADKYTDENRPYEFGFKIDGQQHRHESKDKDGIIMGEFGFITADDVYHVTVYATDKEGRFKILSMKNIHLKSSPASSLGSPTSARQGHALALPPPQPASVQVSAVPQGAPVSQGTFAPQPERPSKPISIQPPGRSCSSCSLPTTTTQAPPPAYNQVTNNNNYNSPNQFEAPGSSFQNQQAPSSPGQRNTAPGGFSGTPYSSQGGQQYNPSVQQNIPQQELIAPDGAQSFAPQPDQTAQNYPGSPSYSQGPGAPNAPNNYAQPRRGVFSSAGQNHGGTGQQAGNDPGSPNYSQGPSAPNVPNNYAQPGGGVLSAPGQNQGGTGQQAGLLQTNSGEQNRLFGGDSSPYAGVGPSGPTSSIPDAGIFGQDNDQQAQLPGSNAQSTGYSSYPQGETGERTSKQYNGPEQQFNTRLGSDSSQGPGSALGGQRGSAKPTLFSAQMQIVDKNTDIHALGPGEQKGLPPGLTQDDMTQLLYTFNYTVGFHGHFEEGYTNGVKKGYYFVTGRNGVKTRIDYVADDTGFHPKVSQEVLDLLSDDVPKPETEKDAKFGLKGYEFKWLYYPVEPKRR